MPLNPRQTVVVSGLLAVAWAGLGCGLIPESWTPTSATPATPATPTPISIPVIGVLGGPAPAPAPSPTGSPTGSPAPVPAPAPTPSASECRLPPSNPSNASCSPQGSAFLGRVDQAITRVTELYPSLFNFKDARCENCYLVKDWDRFNDEVVRELGRRGLCAVAGEELGVKDSNDYNEQFDILLSSGHIRRGAGSYRTTCRPAAF